MSALSLHEAAQFCGVPASVLHAHAWSKAIPSNGSYMHPTFTEAALRAWMADNGGDRDAIAEPRKGHVLGTKRIRKMRVRCP